MNITAIGQVPGNVSSQSSFNLISTYPSKGTILVSKDIVVFEMTPIAADYVTLALTFSDPMGNWSGVGTSQRFQPATPDASWIVQVDTIPPTPTGEPADSIYYELAMTSNQESSPSEWSVTVYA
jgi:hypothetical protein